MPYPRLEVRTDRSLVLRDGQSIRYLMARVVAPPALERSRREPVNVALVLDRSGSMQEERKFGLAREAVESALHMLRSDDRFSLVVYDTEIDVLAPSGLAADSAKRAALRALSEVGPRGGTFLSGGWLRGCEQVAEFLDRDSVGRCLLLTDGLANHGLCDRGKLAAHAGELCQRRVRTSTFGVGADFDERLLRDMAHEGGGNFYFIESASQIQRFLTGELSESLEVTLHDAAIELSVPDGVRTELLNRYRQRRVDGYSTMRIELGDLVASQEIAAVVKLTIQPSHAEDGLEARVRFVAGMHNELLDEATLRWRAASRRENEEQARDVEVDREVAALSSARVRAEATEANRHGDYERAGLLMADVASQVEEYAGTDVEIQETLQQLREDIARYAAPMAAPAMKAAVFAAEARAKGRSLLGWAKRAKK